MCFNCMYNDSSNLLPIKKQTMEILDSRLVELVKNHLEISISTDISNFENVDCTIYNESTADGYDVFVITNDPRNAKKYITMIMT